MKRLAIIGASYLQEPLIRKAKEMGLETHVFAWAAGDVGEKIADHFYPISITEKDEILDKCRQIGIDGICSIASDLAVVTVNYVAEHLGPVGNGSENTLLSTNKYNMRRAFAEDGDPSPRSIIVESVEDIGCELTFPVIVKPLDRSGSRGVCKVFDRSELDRAITEAKDQGFIKKALVEEFVSGAEYSVECISYRGEHHFLALTYKYTTGSPHFIERGHFEPADVAPSMLESIKDTVFHALDTLKMSNGASHSEIKIDDEGNIKVIEIGCRMGGDLIGSSLVNYSTGVDYVKAVIDIALGNEPDLAPSEEPCAAGVRFICFPEDIEIYSRLRTEHPELIADSDVPSEIKGEVTDSSARSGYFIMKGQDADLIRRFMPDVETN